MLPTEPRAAIAALPHLLDCDADECIMTIGMDAGGVARHRSQHPAAVGRPLDEPLLESSLWSDDIRYAAVIVYSDRQLIDPTPLLDAWAYRDRITVHALWAGATRWRSYLCADGTCCTPRGNRYEAEVAGHPDRIPIPNRPDTAWRRARWDDWMQTMNDVARGYAVDPNTVIELDRSLFDIPVRDALLAHAATLDADARAGLDRLLARMTARAPIGSSVPVHTCAAALRYLDGDVVEAAQRVERILDAEEYSLARLLHNGLEMRAPASLLARSFRHFTPQDLLAA